MKERKNERERKKDTDGREGKTFQVVDLYHIPWLNIIKAPANHMIELKICLKQYFWFVIKWNTVRLVFEQGLDKLISKFQHCYEQVMTDRLHDYELFN